MASDEAWNLGWQQGEKASSERKQRKQGLEDEQRGLQEQQIWNDPEMSAQQKAQKIELLFAHEPVESRMGRIGRGLERLTGQGKRADAQKQQADTKLQGQRQQLYGGQPSVISQTPPIQIGDSELPTGPPTTVTGPAPRNKREAVQSGMSSKSPAQLAQESAAAESKGKLDYQGKLGEQNTQQDIAGTQARYAAYEKLAAGKSPEEQERLAEFFGVKSTRATAQDMKRQDYQAMLLSGQVPKDKDGNILSFEAWSAAEPVKGRAAVSPEKLGTPRVGVSGGKNVYALLTPEGWKNTLDGSILKDFRPAPTYAQVAPTMRAVQVVNPEEPGSTEYMSVPEAIKKHAQGTQSAEFKLQMPTGTERQRADLATSALEQIADMQSVLKKRGDMFGPGAGRITKMQQWIGSQDPEAQRMQAAAVTAADHLMGVFGGRSTATGQRIEALMGNFSTNPEATMAALEQYAKAAKTIQSRGMGPAPKAGGGGKLTKEDLEKVLP